MITDHRPDHPPLVDSVEEMGTVLGTEHRSDTIGVIAGVLGRHHMAGIEDIEHSAHGVVHMMVTQIYPCPDECRGTSRMYKSWFSRRWIGEYSIFVQYIIYVNTS